MCRKYFMWPRTRERLRTPRAKVAECAFYEVE